MEVVAGGCEGGVQRVGREEQGALWRVQSLKGREVEVVRSRL